MGVQRLAYCLGFCTALVCAAFGQGSNTFNDVINANGGINTTALDADTANVSGETTLYALEITGATTGNEVQIGHSDVGFLKMYVKILQDNSYSFEIEGATNIPIRFNGHNVPVDFASGLRVVSDATDTGFEINRNNSTGNIEFSNTIDGGGWLFDPLLDVNDFMTVYANAIQISATDSTELIQHIHNVAWGISWDALIDGASTTTIKEWVASATDFVMTNAQLITDATGTTIPAYIENRITARLASIMRIEAASGIFTNAEISNATITNLYNDNAILSGNITFASGSVIAFASNTTVTGLEVETPDLTEVNNTLDTHEVLILQNYADIAELQSGLSIAQGDGIIAVTDTIESGASSYTFEILPEGYQFKQGFPVVRYGAMDFTDYIEILPGDEIDLDGGFSHRGFRTLFDVETTEEHIVRIMYALVDFDGITYQVTDSSGGGLALPTDITIQTFGRLRR